MKVIEVQDEQQLLDIALQHYGTAEAMGEIMANNPEMKMNLRPWLKPDALSALSTRTLS